MQVVVAAVHQVTDGVGGGCCSPSGDCVGGGCCSPSGDCVGGGCCSLHQVTDCAGGCC